MQGVPEQFSDERDSARFRHLAQLPGLELYHAHIADYAFEPHTHEAFGIGTIAAAAALVGLVYLLVRRNKYDENTLSISAVAAAAK